MKPFPDLSDAMRAFNNVQSPRLLSKAHEWVVAGRPVRVHDLLKLNDSGPRSNHLLRVREITPVRLVMTDGSSVWSHEAGLLCRPADSDWIHFNVPPSDIGIPTSAETENPVSAHKLNGDQSVAVATDVFFNEDMATCPIGVKVQLLGAGGVATYGSYNGRDTFWIGWAPVPKRRVRP